MVDVDALLERAAFFSLPFSGVPLSAFPDFGVFSSRGSKGYYFGLVTIETQISVVVLTLCSFESRIFVFLGGTSTAPRIVF